MKMYKTFRNNLSIEEIEVTRQTDSCIWVNDWRGNPRKELKSTNFNDHFETYEEARGYIISRERRKLENAVGSLRNAEERFGEAASIPKVYTPK